MLMAASIGRTVVKGADIDWKSTCIAQQQKLLSKGNLGWGRGGNNNLDMQAPTPTSNLFVQARTVCEITQQELTGIYLLSAMVGKDMIVFTKQPNRTAGNVATKEFMEQFDTIFAI